MTGQLLGIEWILFYLFLLFERTKLGKAKLYFMSLNSLLLRIFNKKSGEITSEGFQIKGVTSNFQIIYFELFLID
jgi:hypothetical protein